MPLFMVRCYDENAMRDTDPLEVEAEDELAAAERICGGPLIDAGKPGQLRAEVWPRSSPAKKSFFYVPAQTISN